MKLQPYSKPLTWDQVLKALKENWLCKPKEMSNSTYDKHLENQREEPNIWDRDGEENSALKKALERVAQKDYPTMLEEKQDEQILATIQSVVDKKTSAGLRYDKGKIRYDLFEAFAMEQLAQVFTKGAQKYEPNNWLKGMPWSKMRASLGRHLAAYDTCQDYDFDPNCPDCQAGTCVNHTSLLHMAQVAWNALALVSYYHHFPQGDDRYRRPLKKVGLDIDEVICDWVRPWCAKFNVPIPNSWYFEWDTLDKFKQMNETGELAEFYMTLPPKFEGPMPIEPACYISHRPIEDSVTKEWLRKHGFPLKPVFHVKDRNDKVRIAKEQGLDYFVDDNYDTYRAMNDAGICCFLFDAEHNKRYDVGYRRIKSLKELPV